ncbi:universal stress protein [Fulvivirga sedimenti]|uniref:Universal stress protein n=1 Tax=Fulvivirga sedimenti TaxID=2879465 RepID=A0A9X1KZH8_9BACT|nr:universal stress protein [Fulvivirga sedimenti]MCA6074739.1 universal stress protein [Fulvivirga sedimenti]MCA6075916.1 universal stress protein [Fulvivirga sedimenti]MCA6077044.1 universal stress protein [Fulvivirga sedimenti]
MNFYKNWLIALDMSDTDQYIFSNLVKLEKELKPERLTFLHVVHPADLPREVLSDIPDLNEPELRFYENRIQQYINESGITTPYDIEVREGHALTVILQLTQDLENDLVVVGKKGNEGLVERKIARKSGISILFVPEKEMEFQHVLVPVDFSEHSLQAMHVAESLHKHTSCLTVYRDSSKYINQVAETVDEVEEILVKRNLLDQKLATYTEHKLKEFVEPFRAINPDCFIEGINKSTDIGQSILKWASNHPADMIIIGARGKTAAAAALLGSVSERVYSGLTDRYLLVVKKPGENVGLIKALLGK